MIKFTAHNTFVQQFDTTVFGLNETSATIPTPSSPNRSPKYLRVLSQVFLSMNEVAFFKKFRSYARKLFEWG